MNNPLITACRPDSINSLQLYVSMKILHGIVYTETGCQSVFVRVLRAWLDGENSEPGGTMVYTPVSSKQEAIAGLRSDFHLESFTHEGRITQLNVVCLQISGKSRRRHQIISDEKKRSKRCILPTSSSASLPFI